MNITKNEAMKEIRLEAKNSGLTFIETNASHNGSPLYKLVDRVSGRLVVDNMSFWCAYGDVQTGRIKSLAGSQNYLN